MNISQELATLILGSTFQNALFDISLEKSKPRRIILVCLSNLCTPIVPRELQDLRSN